MRRGSVLGVGAAGVAGVLGLASAGPGALVPVRAVLTATAEVSVAFVVDFGSQVVEGCVRVPAGSNEPAALSAFTQQEHEVQPMYDAQKGGLMCSINDIPSDGCSQTAEDIYWAYFHGSSGSWHYGEDDFYDYVVTTGDVVGWRYEDGGAGNPTDPPPSLPPDFTAICGSTAPATTATTGANPATSPPPVASPADASGASGSAGAQSPSPSSGASGSASGSVDEHSSGGTASPGAGHQTGTTRPGPARANGVSPTSGQRAPLEATGPRRAGPGGNALAPVLATTAIVLLVGGAAAIGWRRRRAGAP